MRRLTSLLIVGMALLSGQLTASAHSRYDVRAIKPAHPARIAGAPALQYNYGRRRSRLAHRQNAERRTLHRQQKLERKWARARGLNRRALAHRQRAERRALHRRFRRERKWMRRH